MNNTTLKHLSEIAGLSISTVSRALKNHPDISTKTKLLVTELANTLDYEPNINAVNLRTRNNRLFAVIVPSLSDHFHDSIIAEIEKASREHNYGVMILQSNNDPETEAANVRLCKQNRVKGVFVCITADTTDLTPFIKLRESKIPVVFFDRVPQDAGFVKVGVADAAAATMAANLIAGKQKKMVLAIFADSRMLIVQNRLKAFVTIMNQHQINCLSDFATTEEQAEQLVDQYLKHHPDTIFCMTDEILAGTMRTIQKHQLKVPDDVSVVAISHGFIPSLFYPVITHIKIAGNELGKLAVENMFSALSSDQHQFSEIIEPILVKGGSL